MVLFVNTVSRMSENPLKEFGSIKYTKKAGYRIVIHSCRTSFKCKNLLGGDQFERIKDYMKHYKLPFDKIREPDKPIGVAYIDDKGINFRNNWGEITDKLLSRSNKNK